MLGSVVSETLASVAAFLDAEELLDGVSFVIQGGYFELPEGPTPFSVATARLAAGLAEMLPTGNATPACVILVNDIGLNCGSSHCVLSEPSGDPDELVRAGCSDLASVAGLDGRADVIRERVLRNRSLRLAGKVAAGKGARTTQGKVIRPGAADHPGYRPGGFYLAGRGGGDVLLFEQADGTHAAKCPLIMGFLYQDMALHAALAAGGRVVLIDFCRYADRDRVRQGYEVYQRLLAKPVSPPVSLVSVCTNSAGGSPAIFRHDPPANSAGN